MARATRGVQGTGGSWAWVVGTAAATVLLGSLALAVAITLSWREALAQEERVLPGTTIAATDVGGQPGAVARDVAAAAGEAALDRTVTVRVGGVERALTPRGLGGTSNADELAAEIVQATADASFVQVARSRWLPGGAGHEAGVRVRVDEDAVGAFVAETAAAFDRPPRDATAVWESDRVAVQPHALGQQVARAAASAAVQEAIAGGADHVRLPVEDVEPAVRTEMVGRVLPAVAAAVDRLLDRPATIVHADTDTDWQVTPRALGAEPDPAPLVEAALHMVADAPRPELRRLAPGADGVGEIPLVVPYRELAAVVADVAEAVDVAPRDAVLDHSSGWVEIHPERAGQAVDRPAATEALREALRTGEAVELPIVPVAPRVTARDYGHVLLVRQDQRRLYLYRDGEISREWPVAIGQGGSPTPTGVYEIGAKRHLPTWHNPAPEGWGADMPAVEPPGPTNPLGVRALNWNTLDGWDTLIRFHGTSAVGSIGQAASRGCVRLTNPDVTELYDLVPSGTTVVSTWG